MKQHLVFYDGECGLCDAFVQFLLRVDKRESFFFAPLQGKHAEKLPPEKKTLDSVILVEDYKGKKRLYYEGKAAFRTLWLLGGRWRLIGWFNFLPAILYNWCYRLVAANRHRLFPKTECVIPGDKTRFLD